MGPIINLISGTYHLCKRKKVYIYNISEVYNNLPSFHYPKFITKIPFLICSCFTQQWWNQTECMAKSVPNWTFADIMKVCATSCNIAAIHLRCGWFSSAKLINPIVFRRLGYDDCLVNDGKRLGIGESLSFVYANTFSYSG